MKIFIGGWVTVFLLVSLASAQTAQQAVAPHTVSQEINGWVSDSEKELVGIAEDMPEDKYNFAPTNGEFRGVRNFAKQVKHVGAAIQMFSAAILDEPVPADAADERGPDAARTKAEIVKYLKDSYAYLRKAVASIDEKNAFQPHKNPFGKSPMTRMKLVNYALTHSSNHYGQMVEYLRMNGFKPRGSN
ncbi:MAG: DinB family protein [Acidobacteria bacterium]|nr:DinB family protein [Acidobacteriota bacterium]